MNIFDATPFLKGGCYLLFADDHRRGFIDQFKQVDHVGVSHPNAAVAGRCADFVLVFRAVDINETFARIGVVFVRPIEPQNPRHHQIVGRRQRIFRPQGHATAENCPARHVAADLFCDAKIAERCFEAAFLSSDSEAGARDRIRPDRFAAASQRQLLIADGNVDLYPWTLPRRS